MASGANFNTLESMWRFMGCLSPTTTDAELQKVTIFFEPNALVYLNGMSSPPCTSHESLITTTKGLAGIWALAERKVTLSVVSEDGLGFVNAMENDLKIVGQDVKKFPECEVVKFSERGLIKEYLLFCDPSPIMAVLENGKEGSL